MENTEKEKKFMAIHGTIEHVNRFLPDIASSGKGVHFKKVMTRPDVSPELFNSSINRFMVHPSFNSNTVYELASDPRTSKETFDKIIDDHKKVGGYAGEKYLIGMAKSPHMTSHVQTIESLKSFDHGLRNMTLSQNPKIPEHVVAHFATKGDASQKRAIGANTTGVYPVSKRLPHIIEPSGGLSRYAYEHIERIPSMYASPDEIDKIHNAYLKSNAEDSPHKLSMNKAKNFVEREREMNAFMDSIDHK